ncbi:MAG: LCP family protein [Candidatus Kerfeldbacteria bacterium]|nr:LCP family protein [Candidatus Kerfeldbacteria bacterium]
MTVLTTSRYTGEDGTKHMPIQSLHAPQERHPEPASAQLTPRRRSWFWWKIGGAVVLVLLVFIGLVGYRLLAAVNTTVDGNRRVSVLEQLGHIVAKRDAQLKGEGEDRINVLLLGIGGPGHEGPLLTDTIIVASFKPSSGQVTLISIPRDLAVEIPRYGIRKINNANAFGQELSYPGGGEQLTADIVARVTGLTMHYFGRIDFAGFTKIVDDLGGVTLTVERNFADREYPTEDFGYQTISFRAGQQMMDGDTALKFVRSRHGSNGEGSDFARSRRQQLVLQALREEIFSLGTIINPVRIGNILSSLGIHTRTNMEIWELLRLAKLLRESPTNSVTSHVIDSSPNGLLNVATGQDGAFLLVPRDGTFAAVRAFCANIFVVARYREEQARILVRDGSGRNGTAKTVATNLTSLGFSNVTVDQHRSNERMANSQLIDYTNGRKPYTLSGLASYLGLAGTGTGSPLLNPGLVPTILNGNDNVNRAVLPAQPPDTDILFVIGTDYQPALTAKRTSST